jgi:hypothetical protein
MGLCFFKTLAITTLQVDSLVNAIFTVFYIGFHAVIGTLPARRRQGTCACPRHCAVSEQQQSE